MSYSPRPNCPWRKPAKHPLDRAEKIAHVIGGMMLGGFAGSFFVIESFFAVLITEQGTLWIPGGVLLASMTVSGVLAKGRITHSGYHLTWLKKSVSHYFRQLQSCRSAFPKSFWNLVD